MGVRGSDTAEIVLQNVRVPKTNLLGDPTKGFKQFMSTLDGGRIFFGALGVGIAQAALDKALNYAKERTQFGKPIASFQAIQFKLADKIGRASCRERVCMLCWVGGCEGNTRW